MRPRQPFTVGLLLTGALTLVSGAHRLGWRVPYLGDFMESVEQRTADLRFVLRGPRQTCDALAIVAFDDKTFESRPDLFERRAGWARVLQAVSDGGASAIGIDAFFIDPERLLPAQLVDDIDAFLGTLQDAEVPRASRPIQLLQEVQHHTHGDRILTETLGAVKHTVLAIHLGSKGGRDMPAARLGLARGRYGQVELGGRRPEPMHDLMASLPELSRAAGALGTVTVFEDESRTIRELPLVVGYENDLYAPLPVQLVAAHLNIGQERLAYLGSAHSVRIGGKDFPLNEHFGITLNYRGPAGTFPTHSVLDLVEGRLPPNALAGRIVLLGLTHFGHDQARTPFDPAFPAIEVQATAADNLLAGDPIRRAGGILDAGVCLLLGILISGLFIRRLRLPAWLRATGILIFLGLFLLVSAALFAWQNLWLMWLGPITTVALVGSGCLAQSYFGEGQEKRRVRHAFSHYLSDEVIGQLLDKPETLALGGARRQATVLFLDIRGFTRMSESMAPEELISLLNTFFTPMTRTVLASHGFVDKYMGDALMAVFGAPLPDAAHPSQALSCVLAMHAERQRLHSELRARGVQLDFGVGVNTGEVVVGNMGSATRFDYTAVGDAVNLAARLQNLTKTYGVFCLVGEDTRRQAGNGFTFREIDRVQVRGQSRTTFLHELLSGPGGRIATYERLELFEEGLAALRQGHIEQARQAFQVFARVNPDDRVVRLYLEKLDGVGH